MKRALKKTVPNWFFEGLGSLPLRHPTSVSFTITLILLCVQLHFIKPYFLVNDDIFKVLMVRGIGVNPTPTPYFLYSSVCLGFFFMKWFAWFPSHPWYGWFLCAAQFLSVGSLLWILCQKASGWFKAALFIVSCLGTQFVFFMFPQFTITAIMAEGAGLLLFYHSNGFLPGRLRAQVRALSGILLLLSWLIRPHSFWPMLLVMAPLFFFRNDPGNPGPPPRPWKFIAWVGSLILLAFLLDYAWFQKNADWKDFQSFNEEAAALQQQRPLVYSPETKPLFDSVGWSENDLWLFKDFYWMDTEKFDLARIQKLKAGLPRMGSEGKPSSFHSLQELFGSMWDQRVLLYFFLFWMFCGKRAAGFLLAQLAWIVLFFLYLIYFMKAADRVCLPLLAYLANLAVFFAEPPSLSPGARSFQRGWAGARILFCGAAFVLAFPVLRDYYLQNLERQKVEDQMRECLRRMEPMKSRLFFMWGFPFELLGAFDNYDCLRPFQMATNSFIQRSPAAVETLGKFGVRNVLRDMVDNPRILMICSPEEGRHYHDYLKENDGLEISARKELACDYIGVFSVHSNPPPKKGP